MSGNIIPFHQYPPASKRLVLILWLYWCLLIINIIIEILINLKLILHIPNRRGNLDNNIKNITHTSIVIDDYQLEGFDELASYIPDVASNWRVVYIKKDRILYGWYFHYNSNKGMFPNIRNFQMDFKQTNHCMLLFPYFGGLTTIIKGYVMKWILTLTMSQKVPDFFNNLYIYIINDTKAYVIDDWGKIFKAYIKSNLLKVNRFFLSEN